MEANQMGGLLKRSYFGVGVVLVSLCVLGVLVQAVYLTTMGAEEWEGSSSTAVMTLGLDGIVGIVGIALVLLDRRSAARALPRKD